MTKFHDLPDLYIGERRVSLCAAYQWNYFFRQSLFSVRQRRDMNSEVDRRTETAGLKVVLLPPEILRPTEHTEPARLREVGAKIRS